MSKSRFVCHADAIVVPAVIFFFFSLIIPSQVWADNRQDIIAQTLNCLEYPNEHYEDVDCSDSSKAIVQFSDENIEDDENDSRTWQVSQREADETQMDDPRQDSQESSSKPERSSEFESDEEEGGIPPRNPDHRWEFGLDVFKYNYQQESYTNNRGLMSEKANEGNLFGLHAGYEHVLSQNEPHTSIVDVFKHPEINRSMVDLDLQTGKAEYSDISGSPKEDFSQYKVEASAKGGYDFMVTPNTRLTPFIGLGYRFLRDDSGDVLDNPATIIYVPDGQSFTRIQGLRQPFKRHLQYLYLPVGVTTNSNIQEDLDIGFNFEFDYLLWGEQKSFFQDVGTVYDEVGGARTIDLRNIRNRLKGGYGIKASTRLTKKDDKFDLYIEPYLHYWRLKKSDDQQYPLRLNTGTDVILFHTGLVTPYTWFEPENSTTEMGVEVGFVY